MSTNISNRNQNYTQIVIFYAIPLFEKVDSMNDSSRTIGPF